MNNNDRLIILDIIRFVAAMSVLIYHYQSEYISTLPADSLIAQYIYSITKFGYLGVELFFLISGFVIFASAKNRTSSQFFISRATRILPTFWVCMTLTSIVILIEPTNQISLTLAKYIANFFLIYSHIGQEPVDGVYWTLVVEVKFYACVFLLILSGAFKNHKLWLSIWLILIISFLIFNQPFFLGWFISPHYSCYFISGIIFYLARTEGYTKFNTIVLAISFILALLQTYQSIDSFTKSADINDKLIALVLVSLFYGLFFLISKNILNLKPKKSWLLLGGITYSLYLLHNLMGRLIFGYFKTSIDPLLLILLIALAMTLISLFIHIKLERKISDRLKTYLINLLSKLNLDATKKSS